MEDVTPQQPIEAVVTVSKIAKLKEFLAKRHDAAVEDLRSITKITTDEQYGEAEAKLSMAKQFYDMMCARRKEFTDPIKKAIEEVMRYENAINYTAKTDNEYNRARAVLDEYNQDKIKERQQAELRAKMAADLIKYKAEFKAQVQQQLSDMLDGKHRTLIHSMVDWEARLTLQNIDIHESTMREKNPQLKQEDYEKCFRRWGKEPMVMGPAMEDEYLLELKKELPYSAYNERFQQLVAPIKNEYLAKMDTIRERLKAQAAADEGKRKEMEIKAAADREREKDEAIKRADEAKKVEQQAIADQKDISLMTGDFTQQAMTADLESGPSKKVASFADDKLWLAPFLKVVGKVASSPKFKGIHKGEEYVPEIKKWMDFYSQYVGEAMEGLSFEEKAKTIVRKK